MASSQGRVSLWRQLHRRSAGSARSSASSPARSEVGSVEKRRLIEAAIEASAATEGPLERLLEMGVPRSRAVAALSRAGDDGLEGAAALLFGASPVKRRPAAAAELSGAALSARGRERPFLAKRPAAAPASPVRGRGRPSLASAQGSLKVKGKPKTPAKRLAKPKAKAKSKAKSKTNSR